MKGWDEKQRSVRRYITGPVALDRGALNFHMEGWQKLKTRAWSGSGGKTEAARRHRTLNMKTPGGYKQVGPLHFELVCIFSASLKY